MNNVKAFQPTIKTKEFKNYYFKMFKNSKNSKTKRVKNAKTNNSKKKSDFVDESKIGDTTYEMLEKEDSKKKSDNDLELVEAARNGDSLAITLLVVKYRNFLDKYVKLLNVPSGYSDDLIQEGLIGLLKAVRTFQSVKGVKFSTYAETCIKNSVISALRYHRRKFFDNEISIEELDELSGGAFEVVSGAVASSPETEYIDMESSSQLHDTIFSVLSTYEQQVFGMYLSEMPYSLIASRLGKDIKSIDNAIQRIKNKLKKLV